MERLLGTDSNGFSVRLLHLGPPLLAPWVLLAVPAVSILYGSAGTTSLDYICGSSRWSNSGSVDPLRSLPRTRETQELGVEEARVTGRWRARLIGGR
jgi:hypothetical protein